jgi:hypothetical protein
VSLPPPVPNAARVRENWFPNSPSTARYYQSAFRAVNRLLSPFASCAGQSRDLSNGRAIEVQNLRFAAGVDTSWRMSAAPTRRSDDVTTAQQRFLLLSLRCEREIFHYGVVLVPDVEDAEGTIQQNDLTL